MTRFPSTWAAAAPERMKEHADDRTDFFSDYRATWDKEICAPDTLPGV